jgi:hypothetical protein
MSCRISPCTAYFKSKPPYLSLRRANRRNFPVSTFTAGIDLDYGAEMNDAAIWASLIWFKHQWRGGTAEIEGPEVPPQVWAIAAEVGIPLKGIRPGSGQVTGHKP